MAEAIQQNNTTQGGTATGGGTTAGGAGKAASGAALPGAKAPGTTTSTESWASKTFSRDELKSNGSIGRYKSADDFGASYLALEKKLNDGTRISVPGAEASDAERDEFYKALGRPEGPEKYTLNAEADKLKEILPENSPVNAEFVKGAFETFHKIGMNDAQATAVVSFFAQQQGLAMQEEGAAIMRGVEEVKAEWGHAYEAKLAVAGRAIDQLAEGEHAIPGLKELMDPERGDPRFGSSPVLIRLFNWLGTMMGEDQLVEGNQRSEAVVGDLKAKKADLMKVGGPYWDGTHADHNRVIEEVRQINEELARPVS